MGDPDGPGGMVEIADRGGSGLVAATGGETPADGSVAGVVGVGAEAAGVRDSAGASVGGGGGGGGGGNASADALAA